MTTIYELNYITEKGNNINLLFSSKEKANNSLKKDYAVGMKSSDGSLIEVSFVMNRILFD